MNIITCDECHDIVYHSRDERRFQPYEEIDNNIWCYDCLKEANAPLEKEVPKVPNNIVVSNLINRSS